MSSNSVLKYLEPEEGVPEKGYEFSKLSKIEGYGQNYLLLLALENALEYGLQEGSTITGVKDQIGFSKGNRYTYDTGSDGELISPEEIEALMDKDPNRLLDLLSDSIFDSSEEVLKSMVEESFDSRSHKHSAVVDLAITGYDKLSGKEETYSDIVGKELDSYREGVASFGSGSRPFWEQLKDVATWAIIADTAAGWGAGTAAVKAYQGAKAVSTGVKGSYPSFSQWVRANPVKSGAISGAIWTPMVEGTNQIKSGEFKPMVLAAHAAGGAFAGGVFGKGLQLLGKPMAKALAATGLTAGSLKDDFYKTIDNDMLEEEAIKKAASKGVLLPNQKAPGVNKILTQQDLFGEQSKRIAVQRANDGQTLNLPENDEITNAANSETMRILDSQAKDYAKMSSEGRVKFLNEKYDQGYREDILKYISQGAPSNNKVGFFSKLFGESSPSNEITEYQRWSQNLGDKK
jgi:hypothetical protein